MSSHDSYRSILVALDPRDECPSVLEHAARLARRDAAELTVLIATGMPPRLIWLAPGLPENPLESLRRSCERRLSAVRRSLSPGVALTTKLRVGAPLATLLGELHDGRHDLVVVGGSHGRRWKLALVRRSPAPVLMIADEPRVAPPVADRRSRPDVVAVP